MLWRGHITLLTLQIIITEVEAVLNNRPLTYISDDITDPEPLTLAHLLYGWRITKLPHQPAIMEELQDPDYNNAESVRRNAEIQSFLLQHFVSRWKHEYLTSLRECYHPSRTRGQWINVGDVVLVHDYCPRINWKIVVVESLMKGSDGLTCFVNIWKENGATNLPGIIKTVQLPTAWTFQWQMIFLTVVLPTVQDNGWLSGQRSSMPPEDVGDC